MKKILEALFCAISANAGAQTIVSGKVVDFQQNPVDLAYINVFVGDSLAARGYTAQDGNFSQEVPLGKVHLQIGFFEALGLDTIIDVGHNINLGTLAIDTKIQLDEITVTEKRPILTQKPDRVVYNVENDKFTQGRSALDAIARAPRLNVNKQQKSIEMIGRSGVKIMLNGRLQDDASAKNLIQSLTADDIQSIEIIPIPPAKYEASGNYGMINIVTKKNPNYGFSGSLSVEYQFFKEQYDVEPDLTLNYRSKKWELKLGFTPDWDNVVNDVETKYVYTDSMLLKNSHRNGPSHEYATNDIVKFGIMDKY